MPSARHALTGLAALGLLAALACESTNTPSAAAAPPSSSATAASPAPSADEHGRPQGEFVGFLPADRCALCHSAAPTARALTTATGDDVSPFTTWRATPMANSFRDPYWRAQVAREIELAPERRVEIESLCLTCHAPISHHSSWLGDAPPPTMENTLADPLANDGVSCTVCHRTRPVGLGDAATFGGALPLGRDGTIYGPYKEPAVGPMRMHTGFTPTHGAHIQSSALCGSCHTLYTGHGGGRFLEQAPYLEWRNSVYSDESGASSLSQSCQECHMPDVGSMKIARNPGGRDFNIAVRSGVRAHSFVGGNALLAELLRDNAEELGVAAPAAAFDRVANATRAQLAHSTARIAVEKPVRNGGRLEFDVRVENLVGHKFPSGYPSRRAWLRVTVRSGRTMLFDSGAFDESGRLTGVSDEFGMPHHDVIERSDQVQVYELIAADANGRPTTSLSAMTRALKDNRLLPRGWRVDGPHADETAPVGVHGDENFAAGLDRVRYSVELPADAADLVVTAWLLYQPIPPHWVEPLRESATAEAASFVSMYDRATTAPETVAVTIEVVE